LCTKNYAKEHELSTWREWADETNNDEKNRRTLLAGSGTPTTCARSGNSLNISYNFSPSFFNWFFEWLW
jgi:hypothetical protein